ncbi:hypothetical protein Ddc_11783 [Ditylenchus destructor]|nr:hypothetical protein Ddc_11783 [Ditylenchus destructor]
MGYTTGWAVPECLFWNIRCRIFQDSPSSPILALLPPYFDGHLVEIQERHFKEEDDELVGHPCSTESLLCGGLLLLRQTPTQRASEDSLSA